MIQRNYCDTTWNKQTQQETLIKQMTDEGKIHSDPKKLRVAIWVRHLRLKRVSQQQAVTGLVTAGMTQPMALAMAANIVEKHGQDWQKPKFISLDRVAA
jgi:hypothetical protein